MRSWLHQLEEAGPYRRVREGVNRRLADFLGGVIARHPVPGGSRVLEAACGSAYAAHLLAEKPGVRLSVGLDINLRLFNKGGVRGSPAKLVIGDIHLPPFPPGSFDLVWNSSSLEEIEDPVRVAATMAALTRPGGYVFVGVPRLFGPLGSYYLIPSRRLREWLGRPFSGRRLKDILGRCGLSVEAEIIYLAGFFIGMLAQKR